MVVESVVDWILASSLRMMLVVGTITAVIGGIIVKSLLPRVGSVVKSTVRDSFLDGQRHDCSPQSLEESQPATDLKETDEEVMQEARERLEGWFVIRDNGEIELRPQAGTTTQLKGSLLYIFAARVAYDRGKRETPKVSQSELVREVGSYEHDFLSSLEDRGWISIHRGERDQEQPSVELNYSNADNVAEEVRP